MTAAENVRPTRADLQARVDELLWYHSIDVGEGASTKGWWDLRHALPLLPFPDLRGKRCLDVGTWDGFYAYEMEKRGAAEVVAIDIPDLKDLDYPPEVQTYRDFDPSHTGKQPRFVGFHLLHDIFDSKVQWQGANVYELDPAVHGTFDFVIMGSLLVHLRDPVRALDAIRNVTKPDGKFLSIDFIDPVVNAMSMGRPIFQLRGMGTDFQWWLASEAGLRQLLFVAGFDIEDASKRFLLRPGATTVLEKGRPIKDPALRLMRLAFSGDSTPGGHIHRAFLTSRRF